MRFSALLFTAIVCCATVAASSVSAETLQPGTYRMEWRATTRVGYGDAFSVVNPVEPSRLTAVKGLKSTKPYLGEAGPLAIVLDESKGTGAGYDTAFIYPRYSSGDAARQVLKVPLSDGKSQGWLAWSDSKGLGIQARLGGDGQEAVTKPLTVSSIRVYASGKPAFVSLATVGGWCGTVRTDTGSAEVRLFDADYNGAYCDKCTASKSGDMIEVVTTARSDFYDRVLYLGDAVCYGGRLYSITISKSGDSLEVQPYAGRKGTVRVTASDPQGRTATLRNVTVRGDAGVFRAKSGDMVVPQGSYSKLTADLVLPGTGGGVHTFAVRSSDPIEVSPNEITAVNLGGQLKLEIEPTSENLLAQRGKTRTIKLAFNFQKGELTAAGGSKAKVTIADDRGKIVASGTAPFG